MLVEAVFMAPIMIYALFISEDPLPFVYSIFILFDYRFSSFPHQSGFWLVLCKKRVCNRGNRLGHTLCFRGTPLLFLRVFLTIILTVFFESVSGFSTTGGSLFSSIEHLPKTILLWEKLHRLLGRHGRPSFLATAILPASKDRSHNLMRAETPGPTANKLCPKAQPVL